MTKFPVFHLVKPETAVNELDDLAAAMYGIDSYHCPVDQFSEIPYTIIGTDYSGTAEFVEIDKDQNVWYQAALPDDYVTDVLAPVVLTGGVFPAAANTYPTIQSIEHLWIAKQPEVVC